MNTEKIYRGKITGMRQVNVDTLGYRYYELSFNGKKMLYIRHKKSSLNISLGDVIRFQGEFRGIPGHEYFEITNIVDVNDCILWEKYEQEKMAEFILVN